MAHVRKKLLWEIFFFTDFSSEGTFSVTFSIAQISRTQVEDYSLPSLRSRTLASTLSVWLEIGWKNPGKESDRLGTLKSTYNIYLKRWLSLAFLYMLGILVRTYQKAWVSCNSETSEQGSKLLSNAGVTEMWVWDLPSYRQLVNTSGFPLRLNFWSKDYVQNLRDFPKDRE